MTASARFDTVSMPNPIAARWFLVAALATACAAHAAQQRAVTEKGDEVILESDGTWRYVQQPKDLPGPVGVSERRYTRPAASTFAVKSVRNNAAVYIDPKKWVFQKGKDAQENEYSFRLAGGDLYARLITERMTIPLETLPTIALNNLKVVAPDAEIVKQELRWVGDRKVLHMQMRGTTSGIKAAYSGYYYSDDSGTTQLVTFTAQNLMPTMNREVEEFLNGFALQPGP
jgi:hypothetical protein